MQDLNNSQSNMLVGSIKDLAKQMKEGFSSMKEYVDKRFDRQDDLNLDQFKKVHQRIDTLEKNTVERFDETDRKFEEKLDDRLDGVKKYLGAKIDKFDERLNGEEKRVVEFKKEVQNSSNEVSREVNYLSHRDERNNIRITRLEMKVGIAPKIVVHEPAEA